MGSVGDGFEQISASATNLRKRDERAAPVMAAPSAKAERIQILVKLFRRLLRGSLGHVARGRDEVVRRRYPAIGALPARQLPLGKNAGQSGVHGNAAWNLGLRLAKVQRAQGLRLRGGG